MSETTGHEAFAAINRLLADRPNKIGHDFSEATGRLAAWRDALALRWRQSPTENNRRALDRVNAGLSVVLGGQFPLGKVPWPEIDKVREDLGELISEAAGQPATPEGSSSQTTRS
jgi:hypothetical protein